MNGAAGRRRDRFETTPRYISTDRALGEWVRHVPTYWMVAALLIPAP